MERSRQPSRRSAAPADIDRNRWPTWIGTHGRLRVGKPGRLYRNPHWAARTTPASPDFGRGWGQCAHFPDPCNTASQFTSHDFTGVLLQVGIALSMDGKGSWRDNVVVERLWRSIKDEEVYLRASDTVSDARASIARYLAFSNGRRPHSSLDRLTPDQAFFNRLPQSVAA